MVVQEKVEQRKTFCNEGSVFSYVGQAERFVMVGQKRKRRSVVLLMVLVKSEQEHGFGVQDLTFPKKFRVFPLKAASHKTAI